jgi:hypothetical protein
MGQMNSYHVEVLLQNKVTGKKFWKSTVSYMHNKTKSTQDVRRLFNRGWLHYGDEERGNKIIGITLRNSITLNSVYQIGISE